MNLNCLVVRKLFDRLVCLMCLGNKLHPSKHRMENHLKFFILIIFKDVKIHIKCIFSLVFLCKTILLPICVKFDAKFNEILAVI